MKFLLRTAVFLALLTGAAADIYADDPPAAVSEETAAKALAAAAGDLNLQTRMPGEKAPPAPAKGPAFSLPAIPAELAEFLLWGGLAAFLGLIIFKLLDNPRHGRNSIDLQPEAEEAESMAPGAVAARLDQARLEAEELARRGQFAKAMHLLLLKSLGEMRLRLEISIAASLTSREIVVRAPLGSQTRAALADLVGLVEVSHFGDHRAGEPEYLACRASFEILTQNLRAGGRA